MILVLLILSIVLSIGMVMVVMSGLCDTNGVDIPKLGVIGIWCFLVGCFGVVVWVIYYLLCVL